MAATLQLSLGPEGRTRFEFELHLFSVVDYNDRTSVIDANTSKQITLEIRAQQNPHFASYETDPLFASRKHQGKNCYGILIQDFIDAGAITERTLSKRLRAVCDVFFQGVYLYEVFPIADLQGTERIKKNRVRDTILPLHVVLLFMLHVIPKHIQADNDPVACACSMLERVKREHPDPNESVISDFIRQASVNFVGKTVKNPIDKLSWRLIAVERSNRELLRVVKKLCTRMGTNFKKESVVEKVEEEDDGIVWEEEFIPELTQKRKRPG